MLGSATWRPPHAHCSGRPRYDLGAMNPCMERFIDGYVTSGNATRAYIDAGIVTEIVRLPSGSH